MLILSLVFATQLFAQDVLTEDDSNKDSVPREWVCHAKWGDKACRDKAVGSLCNHNGEAGLCAVQSVDSARPECACLEIAGDDFDHLVR